MASRRGRLVVIAGPSGVGKGSLVNELLSRDPDGLAVSVSATTRTPRPGEEHGRDYYFVSDEEFDGLVASGDLLEWAEIVGHRSGTPRGYVDDQLAGRDVVLEIDVQGAAQVRDRVPEALLIFLAPPSVEELERRLRGRGTETEDRIRRRLETAHAELGETGWFDHVVVNEDLMRAADEVAAIIEGFRSDVPEDAS